MSWAQSRDSSSSCRWLSSACFIFSRTPPGRVTACSEARCAWHTVSAGGTGVRSPSFREQHWCHQDSDQSCPRATCSMPLAHCGQLRLFFFHFPLRKRTFPGLPPPNARPCAHHLPPPLLTHHVSHPRAPTPTRCPCLPSCQITPASIHSSSPKHGGYSHGHCEACGAGRTSRTPSRKGEEERLQQQIKGTRS